MRTVLALLKVKKIATILLLIASLSSLLVLIYMSWGQASTINWAISWWPVAAAIVVYSLSLGAATLGWHLICIDLSLVGDFRTNARIYVLSNAARRLPGGIWGIGSRVYLYRLEGCSEIATSLAIAVETAAVGLSVVLITLMFVPFVSFPETLRSRWPILVLAGIVLAALLHPRVLSKGFGLVMSRVFKDRSLVPTLKNTPARRVSYWLGSFGLAWLISGMVTYLIMRSIYDAPLVLAPAVLGSWMAAGAISMVVVIAPSSFGITEITFAALLSAWVPLPVATATALAVRLFLTISEMIWATALIRFR